jgi:hypothetical protein
MNCEDRSGFLFAHACDRVATVSCTACGKHVCALHLRGEGGRPLCVACAATAAPAVTDARKTTDDPYLYGAAYGYTTYDADDSRAFSSGHRSSWSSHASSRFEGDADAT